MDPALRLVIERLPDVRQRAARLFRSDEVFRELCDEYRICDDAATRLAGARSANRALYREYVALRLRLAGELLRYLSAQADA
jgi:hypothetical protein